MMPVSIGHIIPLFLVLTVLASPVEAQAEHFLLLETHPDDLLSRPIRPAAGQHRPPVPVRDASQPVPSC